MSATELGQEHEEGGANANATATAAAPTAPSQEQSDGQGDPTETQVSDSPATDVGALQSRLEQAEAKAAEHWDRLLRLQAELDNQRKRSQRDIENAHKFALENFSSELLAVRDSLEMGLQAARAQDTSLDSIIDGTELTLKMLVQVMEKFNVVEVNPIGKKFDPELHQAMSMQSVEGAEPNSVTQVIQKGYTLNDRLIRPALVIVAQ